MRALLYIKYNNIKLGSPCLMPLSMSKALDMKLLRAREVLQPFSMAL